VPQYALGLDFGTESARALIVDVRDGSIAGQATAAYPHGVIDARLPRPTGITLYGRIGDLIFWLAAVGGLAIGVPWIRLRRGWRTRGVGVAGA